ncbi:hypothetical protein CAPTEDRAFT_175820 [Capitella teleta]|uniref:PHD-type domain-containing protein n=1 Tax=Capitella teleta TaxID=283909 RepID=R7V8R2_CAPTE|nr:hypothetical protein CAPTEDRAFT_175820 [Capitella teleta]|eukprot:ELU12135.1 hypothetical protein CAPTEDRAFT_175820 [Capitella teleta]
MSHTSSENTSPSKNDEMVSPSRREILSPPSRLPSVHSPLHIPSSPSSPEPSPGPPLPYHALHHTPSTSPSPKRGRIDSVDSFTDLESDIKRKLSRSPVRHLSPPPPRTPSPATSSSSGPVSPGSPEAPLPTPLITQTVAAKAGKGPPASSGVFSETVGKIVDESGQITWICPTCKKADDGSPMIGCDNCDDWYHWFCVGITREPSDEQWYCVRCTRDLGLGKGRGGGRGRKYKRGGGRGGMAFKAKRGRKKVM